MEKPNLTFIDQLSRGDEAIRQRFIGILKSELPTDIEAYYSSCRSEQWDRAAECVHKLKNKIGVLGLEEGYQLADEYEKNVAARQPELREPFEKILTLIQGFTDSL